MAKIQFLTILLTGTCFLGSVVSVTDTELEDLVILVHQQSTTVKQLLTTVQQMQSENKDLVTTVQELQWGNKDLVKSVQQLKKENKVMRTEMQRQDALIRKLTDDKSDLIFKSINDFIQNTTIEERVALLEIQVVVIQDDVTDLEVNLLDLEGDVDFLFDEQVIQDERLLNLEETTNEILGDVDNLQDATLALDFRVTALEEKMGDGNSSVAEIEVRVETLEGTAADHETRISTVETGINDLDVIVSQQDIRLMAAEENIQGLQITDVELDARVTALEETSETVAFHTVLTTDPTISEGSPVLFNEVLLNQGNGYDSTTGTFTVPPGGDGYYYFSTYLLRDYGEMCYFDLEINGDLLCSARTDQEQTITDYPQSACDAVAYATEGDTVQVLYDSGTDDTPVRGSSSNYYTGFTGFRI